VRVIPAASPQAAIPRAMQSLQRPQLWDQHATVVLTELRLCKSPLTANRALAAAAVSGLAEDRTQQL